MRHSDTTEAILGIEAADGNSSLVLPLLIMGGLPVGSLDRLAEVIAPDDAGFKFRVVPKATLERRRKSASQKLTAEEGDRLARLAKVFSFALEIYEQPDRARNFMTRPHAMLDGEKPLDVALGTGAGADIVINLLGRTAYSGGV